MEYKLISYKEEASDKMAAGAQKLADAVVSTLGPRAKTVAINFEYPSPIIIGDGVKIAKSIRLRDPFEDMGAQLIKEAAVKTNDLAGDGTTTATLLANTIFQEGRKLVKGGVVDGVIAGKINSMVVREQLSKYADVIIEKLEKKSKKLKTPDKWKQVATISSGNDEIGGLVADAITAVGNEGVIMVEHGTGFDSSLEVQEGMEFDNGFLSPYFVTNPDKLITEYTDGYILLTDQKISDPMSLVSIIDQVIKDENKPIIIIADDVVGPALQALVMTKLKLNAKIVAVVAPEFGPRRKEMLEDIAVLTGTMVFSRELGHKLEDVKLSDLGRFRSIHVDQERTKIIPKHVDQDEIKERLSALKLQIDAEQNAFKKEKLEMRLGKLSQKVAIIKLGGGSESLINEKYERAYDAVNATKAAISEGIVAGGGVALRDIADTLENIAIDPVLNLVCTALYAPFRTILSNAGLEIPTEWEAEKGVNSITGETVDMIQAGIIDPVRVTRLAVQRAFSIAGQMLTTETLITDPYEDNNKKQVA